MSVWPMATEGNTNPSGFLDPVDEQRLPTLNEIERDALYRRYAARFILESPGRIALLGLRKQFVTWCCDADGYSMNVAWMAWGNGKPWTVSTGRDWAVKWCFQAYYVAMLALLGYLLVRHFRRVDLSLLILVAMFMANHFLFLGAARYHFPVIPVVDLYAAWACCSHGRGDRLAP